MSTILPGQRPLVMCTAQGIPALGPSGASAHLRGVARALGAPILAARRSDARGEHDAVGIEVIAPEPPAWPGALKRWRELNELRVSAGLVAPAMAYNPTLLWERHSLYSVAGQRIHARGIPWVLELNAPLALERAQFESLAVPWLARRLELDTLQAAPRVLAVSAWLTEWARANGAKDVRHVPNGMEPAVGDRDGTRQRLGIEGRFVIGFLGSMKPWHGVERLPDLLDAFPDALGLCVGEGPVRVEHPRLICVGQVSERAVADHVAAMDIGLAPYQSDAPPWFCPLKILAYRAQGTPVVASAIGDCALLTGDGGYCGPDLQDGIEAWRGRRAAPRVRSWGEVVGEGLRE